MRRCLLEGRLACVAGGTYRCERDERSNDAFPCPNPPLEGVYFDDPADDQRDDHEQPKPVTRGIE